MKGTIKSRVPEIGEQIGYWTIMDNKLVELSRGHYAIKCKCKCGTESMVRVWQLMKGTSMGCPCRAIDKNREKRNYVGDISDTLWSRIQKCARVRGIDFNLTKAFAWQLFLEQHSKCALSGIPLILTRQILRGKGQNTITASLDRIDSTLSYTENNVQWVHKDVNKMKQDLTEVRLRELCKLIIELEY